MKKVQRAIARQIANKQLQSGDPPGWFEELYSLAGGNASIIPWADLAPNPNLIDWLNRHAITSRSRALKIGSGPGDDAEELARRGFETTAFDISGSAIAWSGRRFPESPVSYIAAELFSSPKEWLGRFDLVVESYTLEVLPPNLRPDAARRIASFTAAGGMLLVIARGSEPGEDEGKMPWPLTKNELSLFEAEGL